MLALTAGCLPESAASPTVAVLDDLGTGHWASVTTGYAHTCALDTQGHAWCWGSNRDFQLGVGQTAFTCGADATPCSPVPVPVATGRAFFAISAGRSHTCAISTDSVPFCWGANGDRQLGVTGTASPDLRIPGNAAMRAIAAGNAHTCGVRTDDQLICWGSNKYGAVGASIGTGVPPTVVGGNQRFTTVEVSEDKSCARTTAGRVMCWGALWSSTSNDTNYATIRPAPGFVAGLGTMALMDVGTTSTCGIDPTGFVWCWEANGKGESGAGPGPGNLTPRRVATDEEFIGISVGNAFACGVTTDGAGYCWGSNRNLQLGTTAPEFCGPGNSPCATRPIRIVGRQRFLSISAGLGTHACGVTDQFNLYCWGAGASGQRGDGTTVPYTRVPRLAVAVHKQ